MELSAKLLQLYRHLWTSYWCIPVAFLLLSVALAAATTGIDHVFKESITPAAYYLRAVEPDTARVILSTIAGSIIGVAGVVFSITMVAVSFASGNFGPRLIGNMMRDRGSQVSLGCFIGTFVFSLIALRFVRDGGDGVEAFTPYVSIATSMGLALACMGVLIYFIHHVPETINIELIVAKLGRALKSGIESRFRVNYVDVKTPGIDGDWRDDADRKDATEITLAEDGYIQALDVDRLDEIASLNSLYIEILRRPGAFVTNCDPVCAVWHKEDFSRETEARVQACFATGASPTVNQNIEFVADQLVEIIARALSPGVNDPYTAIACINWLKVGILHFAEHETENDTFNRHQRVKSKPYMFKDFVTAIFESAIPYIAPNRQVTRHTIDCLEAISEQLTDEANRKAVAKIISDLNNAADDR